MDSRQLDQQDLDLMLNIKPEIWKALSSKSLFITGGTGFFGIWILSAIKEAFDKGLCEIKVVALSRNPESFLKKHSQFRNLSWLTFCAGNVENFVFPEQNFDYLIHAATDASNTLNIDFPIEMLETNIQGTRRILDFALHNNIPRILYVSSGAVYGDQPAEIKNIDEDFLGSPNPLKFNSAYGEGKRVGELLCNLYSLKFGISFSTARCFAFIGPYLPLDAHFAIGNFILDGLKGNQISVNGDGTPQRSYLYAADLVVWLLVILLKGEDRQAYNVGSDEALSIEQLAKSISSFFSHKPEVGIKGKKGLGPIQKYVPLIDKAKKQLDLQVYTPLKEGIKKTIDFNRKEIASIVFESS